MESTIDASKDRHLLALANDIGVSLRPSSFIANSALTKVTQRLTQLAPSTAENYIWRLHRWLAATKGFPTIMLRKYAQLLAYYKILYPPLRK